MPKLRTPLKENEFYCVKLRKRVKGQNICVTYFNNNKIGRVPALTATCPETGINLIKFIKHDPDYVDKMVKKYGKC